MPLVKELSRTSRDSFESESDSKESWAVQLNSPKVAFFVFASFEGIKPIVPGFFRIGIQFERIPGRSTQFAEKRQKSKMPLLGELGRTSRDSFESGSDPKESRDGRLNSPKSGILNFWRFTELSVMFFRVGRSQPIGASKPLSPQYVSMSD